MSHDQLFKKDRIRREKSLRRQKAKRSPYDVVLIVCEGTKTEPKYFKEMIKAYSLNTANVIVCDTKHGSDPLSVVKCAEGRLRENRELDFAYCVFDRDKHRTFNDAMQVLGSSRYKNKLVRILSDPCFEFWLLLHFAYTTKSFCVAGDDSNCNEVIKELKKYITNYQKGDDQIFQKTRDQLETAITRAEAVEKDQEATGTSNPSTEVYKLVRKLLELSRYHL